MTVEEPTIEELKMQNGMFLDRYNRLHNENLNLEMRAIRAETLLAQYQQQEKTE